MGKAKKAVVAEVEAPVAVVWDKAKVQDLLAKNDKAVCRAVLVIYANQTGFEQAAHATVEHNGVGFAALDAEILSSFAKFYKRTGFLTAKQVAVARKKITKYWRQLLVAAQVNGAVVSFK